VLIHEPQLNVARPVDDQIVEHQRRLARLDGDVRG
jgi:hypothetical protein